MWNVSDASYDVLPSFADNPAGQHKPATCYVIHVASTSQLNTFSAPSVPYHSFHLTLSICLSTAMVPFPTSATPSLPRNLHPFTRVALRRSPAITNALTSGKQGHEERGDLGKVDTGQKIAASHQACLSGVRNTHSSKRTDGKNPSCRT